MINAVNKKLEEAKLEQFIAVTDIVINKINPYTHHVTYELEVEGTEFVLTFIGEPTAEEIFNDILQFNQEYIMQTEWI